MQMTNQRLSVLLIVLMVMTPVASAFSHCAAMLEAGHFPQSQISTVAAVASHHQNTDQHNQQMKSDSCHTGTGCTLHVCGGHAMTSSASTFDAAAANRYATVLHTSLESTILSPEIPPP